MVTSAFQYNVNIWQWFILDIIQIFIEINCIAFGNIVHDWAVPGTVIIKRVEFQVFYDFGTFSTIKWKRHIEKQANKTIAFIQNHFKRHIKQYGPLENLRSIRCELIDI